MKHVENTKNHQGIPTHRNGPVIHFLRFADDYIIFEKTSQNASNNINGILQNFCALFGQLVNFTNPMYKFLTICNRLQK